MFAKFQAPKSENSEPEKLQFHTPSHSIPPLDSLLQIASDANNFPVLPFLGFSVLPRKNLKLTKDFCPPAEPTKTLEKPEKRTDNQGNSLKLTKEFRKTKEKKDSCRFFFDAMRKHIRLILITGNARKRACEKAAMLACDAKNGGVFQDRAMRNACDSDSRCGLACDASARDAKSLAIRVERCKPLSASHKLGLI